MEKNGSTFHTRPKKRISTQNSEQQQINDSRVNNYMCCKLTIINIDQISEEFRVNKWRYSSDYPIFKVYHFSHQNHSPGQVVSKIVYELPQTLLFQIPKPLSLPCCLYVIKTLLLTTQRLIQQFGYFKLTQKMVGITRDKICKMWVNENLQQNQVMLPVLDQQQTVDSIKQICENILSRNILQQKFISSLRTQKHSIIKMNQFIWEFSYQNSILIPPFFENNKDIIIKSKKNKFTHKKTRSQLPSPSPKSLKAQNRSQQRLSQDQQAYKVRENLMDKTIQQPIWDTQKLTFNVKLNKSSNVTNKQRLKYKSDFIDKEKVQTSPTQRQKEKQNLSYTTTTKINRSIKDKTNEIHARQIEKYEQIRKSEQNKQKMKNMVKQKIRINRQKKRVVVKLQAINTVKSIGQITESEKKTLGESGLSNCNKNNFNLELLHLLCNKVGKSRFRLDTPGNQEESDTNIGKFQNQQN